MMSPFVGNSEMNKPDQVAKIVTLPSSMQQLF
jgi:hypothetical protein